MSAKQPLGGLNAILRKQREETAARTNAATTSETAPSDIKLPHDIKSPDANKPSDALKARVEPFRDVTKSPTPMTQSSGDTVASDDIKSPVDEIQVDPARWTAFPNDLSDRVMRTLELSDQSVLNRLYRLTRGFHQETCKVSKESLAEACNLHSRQIPRSTKRLVARGLIEIVGHDTAHPDPRQRGTIYRILIPAAAGVFKASRDLKSPGDNRPSGDFKSSNKIKALKENTKRENELALDIKDCPDCQGSGFWYPEGTGKGVAKCKHIRLTEGK
jgi:hypothetical protein